LIKKLTGLNIFEQP